MNVVPSVSTSVTPGSVNVGESAVVTVSLNNVPADGYTSAEFTCTYDANRLEASNIAIANLFGIDAATAINGPANGSFIVATAGSNGNKATSNGTVLPSVSKVSRRDKPALNVKRVFPKVTVYLRIFHQRLRV